MPIEIKKVNYGIGVVTNLTILQGESVNLNYQININGAPFNLTAATIKMQIGFCGSPLLLDTANGGIVITNPAAGEFQLIISDVTTETFQPGQHSYDMFIIDSGGNSKAYQQGLFIVAQAETPIP